MIDEVAEWSILYQTHDDRVSYNSRSPLARRQRRGHLLMELFCFLFGILLERCFVGVRFRFAGQGQ
jgi:hypothetical protein